MSTPTVDSFPGHVRTFARRGQPPRISSGRRSTVVASLVERGEGRRREVGLATIDLATTDFNLFTIADSRDYAKTKSLIRALGISDVIMRTSKRAHECCQELQEVTTITTTERSCYGFKFGTAMYDALKAGRDSTQETDADKNLSLIAFGALVKLVEHLNQRRCCRSVYRISFHAVDEQLGDSILCPLCEEAEEKCELWSIHAMQDHFVSQHWQVHGFACHACGQMHATAADLAKQHPEECDEFKRWMEQRGEESSEKKLSLSHCRVLLCCADCGWHAPLAKKEGDEEGTIREMKAFLGLHCNDGLLPLLIYFAAEPSEELEGVKFAIKPTTGGDPLAPCAHCGARFRGPLEANQHCMKEHGDKVLSCGECNTQAATQYLLRQHQLAHVHDNAYLADYLTNSARIVPPPEKSRSVAARVGWKHGARGEQQQQQQHVDERGEEEKEERYDLMDPAAEDDSDEDEEMAVRRVKKREKEEEEDGDGAEQRNNNANRAKAAEESWMAIEVMTRLKRDYANCDFVRAFDDRTWLKDEDALRFKQWMDYWESEKGKAEGGPPKAMEIETTVRIPAVDVELKFAVGQDFLSGYVLDDDVYYCSECDTILKGAQAKEHLKRKRGGPPNACAMNGARRVTDPAENENLLPLHSALSSAASSLPCAHCAHRACSITGLRAHVAAAHDRFVAYEKEVGGEAVTESSAILEAIRSRWTRKDRADKRDGHGHGDGDDDVITARSPSPPPRPSSRTTAVKRGRGSPAPPLSPSRLPSRTEAKKGEVKGTVKRRSPSPPSATTTTRPVKKEENADDDAAAAADAAAGADDGDVIAPTPNKRGRGRPLGSTKKKRGAQNNAAPSTSRVQQQLAARAATTTPAAGMTTPLIPKVELQPPLQQYAATRKRARESDGAFPTSQVQQHQRAARSATTTPAAGMTTPLTPKVELQLQQEVAATRKRARESDGGSSAARDALKKRAVKVEHPNAAKNARAEKQLKDEKEEEEKPVVQHSTADTYSDVVVVEPTPKPRSSSQDSIASGGVEGGVVKEKMEDDTEDKPKVRDFTPDSTDDLCVVTEVKNEGCSPAAAVVSKKREKKWACPKCSDRFIAQATLTNHLRTAHLFDAGQSTLVQEFGIPLGAVLWICRNCCLAFPTRESKIAHSAQHNMQNMSCRTCSACAYNQEVMDLHVARVADQLVSYMCGECKEVYTNETALHEHSNTAHGVPIFYFCKSCEMGSTSSLLIYKHVKHYCPGKAKRTTDLPIECIGVCPAAQLHYQPPNVEMYERAMEMHPTRYVTPSLCNHRSMIVATDRQVACTICRCLENIQHHFAMESFRAGQPYEMKPRMARPVEPLERVRRAYEEWKASKQMAQSSACSSSSSDLRVCKEEMNGAVDTGRAAQFGPPLIITPRPRLAQQVATVSSTVDTSHEARFGRPSAALATNSQHAVQQRQRDPSASSPTLASLLAPFTPSSSDLAEYDEGYDRFKQRLEALQMARRGGGGGTMRPSPSTPQASAARGVGGGSGLRGTASSAQPIDASLLQRQMMGRPSPSTPQASAARGAGGGSGLRGAASPAQPTAAAVYQRQMMRGTASPVQPTAAAVYQRQMMRSNDVTPPLRLPVACYRPSVAAYSTPTSSSPMMSGGAASAAAARGAASGAAAARGGGGGGAGGPSHQQPSSSSGYVYHSPYCRPY